ncbi:Nitroreductase family protein [Actinokineospora alba]|uniref:Nitroreductase family protein n=1 Tax=Actinokineospora alba TaxID=504798 RepID=A0A1H0FM99_9PSEU|nr:nitroreductase family protein [Actinokineospora alba]TDP69531.1 nitroreductase family protein [Actinokineospora alba]SDI14807.1 Nitroreductase family protein [Actinokineospora alba]SDN95609.1 Nitroreductase family protein [Actinokineospora alba]
MAATDMDRVTVNDAIELAARAPSVHNSQPWRWLIGDDSVHLMADWSRQVPATDPQGRDLLISCGAALHHLRVAFAALGYATLVHRIPNPATPDHLAAVEFVSAEPSREDVALASAITRRRTDRRAYSSWPVPAELLDLLVERAAHEGVIAIPVTDTDARYRLAVAMELAAERQQRDPEYAAEIAQWSGRSRVSTDGVPAVAAPAGSEHHGDTRMRTFTGGELRESPVRRGEPDAGELIVLATPGDDALSRLRAGEAASAVLLTATELGLASCPLSQAVEVADSRILIRDTVLDGAAIPQLVLRVGWAPTSAEPLPASARRAVADISATL